MYSLHAHEAASTNIIKGHSVVKIKQEPTEPTSPSPSASASASASEKKRKKDTNEPVNMDDLD